MVAASFPFLLLLPLDLVHMSFKTLVGLLYQLTVKPLFAAA